MNYHFFDHASTTRCCQSAVELICRFASEDFGNPSSSHIFGQQAARAIREARQYFAKIFEVGPEQVIFTGSGSEADNLAIYGTCLSALAERKPGTPPPQVLASSIEHPAVRATVKSLTGLGIETQMIPVDSQGQIQEAAFLEMLTPSTLLVSIMQVNNILGVQLPVEELARKAKAKVPGLIFHTDAVQAFGKVKHPSAPSPVDLVSISGHKVQGPKGIGALIVLNKALLKSGLRPLIWGGDQEGGFRSGTQSAGLISGFHAAAEKTLQELSASTIQVQALRDRFEEKLRAKKLLGDASNPGRLRWNSPRDAVPHIVSVSVPGFPGAPLAKLLEERGCLVSTGSACSSQKSEPDPVLSAMGLPSTVYTSALRVSFSSSNTLEEVDLLADAFEESIQLMATLLGEKPSK